MSQRREYLWFEVVGPQTPALGPSGYGQLSRILCSQNSKILGCEVRSGAAGQSWWNYLVIQSFDFWISACRARQKGNTTKTGTALPTKQTVLLNQLCVNVCKSKLFCTFCVGSSVSLAIRSASMSPGERRLICILHAHTQKKCTLECSKLKDAAKRKNGVLPRLERGASRKQCSGKP